MKAAISIVEEQLCSFLLPLREMAIGFATWCRYFQARGRPVAMSSIAHEIHGQLRAVCWDGRQGVRFGKTAEAKFSQLQADVDAQCV